MKPPAVAVAALVLAGCLVVPKQTTTKRDAGTTTSAPRYGTSRGLALSTSASRGIVTVQVTRSLDCQRDTFRVTEVTERRHLGIGGASDPRALVFGAILAPATLPISLVVSSFAVAADRESTRREQKLERTTTLACTQPAENVLVRVALPSGVSLEQRTNAVGAIAFRIPTTEPDQGAFVVKAESQVLERSYKRRSPTERAVSALVSNCAELHGVTNGTLDVTIEVNQAGMPVRVDLANASTPVTTCITTRVARLLFTEHDRGTTLQVPVRLGL